MAFIWREIVSTLGDKNSMSFKVVDIYIVAAKIVGRGTLRGNTRYMR